MFWIKTAFVVLVLMCVMPDQVYTRHPTKDSENAPMKIKENGLLVSYSTFGRRFSVIKKRDASQNPQNEDKVFAFPVNVSKALSKNRTMMLDYVKKPFINSKDFPNKERIERLLRLKGYNKSFLQQEVRTRAFQYYNDHVNLCEVQIQDLDPKVYFNTSDRVFPDRYRNTTCSGKLGSKGFPVCVYGIFHCITLYQDIPVLRKSRKSSSSWYRDQIRDVPVGCACSMPL